MPLADPALDELVEADQDTDTPWRVILWNDPVNMFDHVIMTLMAAPFAHPREEAEVLTLAVHNDGKATVASADTKDEADIYLNALTAAMLWATVEKG